MVDTPDDESIAYVSIGTNVIMCAVLKGLLAYNMYQKLSIRRATIAID